MRREALGSNNVLSRNKEYVAFFKFAFFKFAFFQSKAGLALNLALGSLLPMAFAHPAHRHINGVQLPDNGSGCALRWKWSSNRWPCNHALIRNCGLRLKRNGCG